MELEKKIALVSLNFLVVVIHYEEKYEGSEYKDQKESGPSTGSEKPTPP